MKKGYWVVAYRKIGDEAMMKRYLELAGIALRPFGSRLLVSPGSSVQAKEAGLKQMTVVVEFDSYDAALAAYDTADYKKALDVFGPEVERIFGLLRGLS